MSTITSPTDIVNLALRRIGHKLRVGDLYDGSDAGKAALDIYGNTRDAVLRMFPWGFAEKIASASASGQSPPDIWGFEYAYPGDCIQIRNLYPTTTYAANQSDPLPNWWSIGYDAVGNRVIWTNVNGIKLVYTARVTDPGQMDPLFIEKLALELAMRLAPQLSSLDVVKLGMDEGKELTAMAEGTLG